jgi:hypothetical protein
MAFLNRCIWTAASAGTGSFVVASAAQNGYTPGLCLDPSVVDGATYHYYAVNGSQHEEGDGVYTVATSTLTRAVIRNSSSGGGLITFTSPPIVTMGGPISTDLGAGGIIGFGTTGSVVFIGATGAPAQDNANFFWNDASFILTIAGALTVGASGVTQWTLQRAENGCNPSGK